MSIVNMQVLVGIVLFAVSFRSLHTISCYYISSRDEGESLQHDLLTVLAVFIVPEVFHCYSGVLCARRYIITSEKCS
jgi:hypothetical protein